MYNAQALKLHAGRCGWCVACSVQTYQRTGYFSKHFESAWNYVDVLSICHNIFGSTLWVYMAVYCATEFDIELAYDIYEHKG